MDYQSHLLQGVRVSTEFLNSLMWYASITNVTNYHGDARVLDSHVNGTISYTPPVIRVEKDNLLSIGIGHGLLLATCTPMAFPNAIPATLFKAEFSDLSGSGKIKLASTRDKTGLRVSLDDLDLSRMVTKPFEPKLPLPESFENELMKNAIAQLQPVVNQYLKAKPLYLPENIAPFAASPELYLWNTGNGTGYAEMMSYCTCNKDAGLESGSSQIRKSFALCDPRSHICDGKGRKAFEITTLPPRQIGVLDGIGETIRDGITGLVGVAKDVINYSREEDREETEDEVKSKGHKPSSGINFTALFEDRALNISYRGVHFTLYEDSLECHLAEGGDNAKVFWLWKTHECTPLYLHGKSTNQYYYMDDGHIDFQCGDPACKHCQFKSDLDADSPDSCVRTSSGESFRLGAPQVDFWPTRPDEALSIIANVFFNEEFCSFLPGYVEPQLLSSHTNIGSRRNQVCAETRHGDYISNHYDNHTVLSANWDCSEKCFGCLFRVNNVNLGTCHKYESKMQLVFSQTVHRKEASPEIVKTIKKNPEIIWISLGALAASIFVVVGAVLIWKKKSKLRALSPSPPLPQEGSSALPKDEHKKSDQNSKKTSIFLRGKNLVARNIGLRFLTWRKADWKEIREDIIQNSLLLVNGSLAIIFALEWNSDNNPLLIIHNKFQDGLTVSVKIFATDKVAEFASTLNYLTSSVNIGNAVLSYGIVLLWIFSKTGDRSVWMRARLLSSITLLVGIFVVIAAVIFSTYFDDLVLLQRDQGFFITDNNSMYNIASQVLKVSLNGLSLTVISFTIVFLFHGVGGGLYCGTVVFRILHSTSKRSNMEILTTLLVILTVIQPFISLHPVIIWSQDSNNNSTFLILIILIWFLPVIVHMIVKAAITQGRPQCAARIKAGDPKNEDEENRLGGGEPATQRSRTRQDKDAECQKRKQKYLSFFDFAIQVLQLFFFLASFSIITHHIIHTEFNKNRQNLQAFVLPAIVSVFFWMVSISYFLLSLVVDETRKEKRLVFKDQNLEAARSILRQSLRRRLSVMDRHHRSQPPNFRAATLNNGGCQGDYNVDGAEDETTSLSHSMRKTTSLKKPKRSTLPPNLDLSSSLNGRRVLYEDTSFIQVKQDSSSSEGGGGGGGGESQVPPGSCVKLKIKKFESSDNPVPVNKPKVRRKRRQPVRPSRPAPSPPPPPVSIEAQEGEIEEVSKKEVEPSVDDAELDVKVESKGCWSRTKQFFIFILERREYRDPITYGWRIKFRRIFLTMGVILFTFLTVYTTISSQDFSSKEEIQTLLDYAGTNLTWPDSGSVLDDVFQLYNNMERAKSYIMMGASVMFWASLALDFSSYFSSDSYRKALYFTGSRVANFFGSLTVFASVIVVGLPDYLEASHLDEICPFCGQDFNRTVRQVAEFSIGLFFACLFTFQLLPILITIGPALVRASVLILIHPSLQVEDDELTSLRMTILKQVIQFSSFLTFPITFISMAILQQYQKDPYVTAMILLFWCLPPLVLGLGLHYTWKYRRYTILLYVYYFYNFCYFALLLSLLLYSLALERIIETLGNMMQEPTFWASSMAQVFLCNVVISDMLYMTVF